MKMQAAVLTETHTPFRIETVDLAPPQAGEVPDQDGGQRRLP